MLLDFSFQPCSQEVGYVAPVSAATTGLSKAQVKHSCASCRSHAFVLQDELGATT